MDWDKRTFITNLSDFGKNKKETLLQTELQKTARELAKQERARRKLENELKIAQNRLKETFLRTDFQDRELRERRRQFNAQIAANMTGKVLDSLKLTGILVILGLLLIGPAVFESIFRLVKSAPPLAWVVLIGFLILMRR